MEHGSGALIGVAAEYREVQRHRFMDSTEHPACIREPIGQRIFSSIGSRVLRHLRWAVADRHLRNLLYVGCLLALCAPASDVKVLLAHQPTTNATSGRAMPGAKAFTGLRLNSQAAVTRALDSDTGQYEVTLTIEITKDHLSTSDNTGRTIHFKAYRATLVSKSKQTDAQGKASAVFRCDRNQIAMLSAEFHNAKIEIEAKASMFHEAGDRHQTRYRQSIPPNGVLGCHQPTIDPDDQRHVVHLGLEGDV
jgi:hypothetical protein